jgi:hypothetical protein
MPKASWPGRRAYLVFFINTALVVAAMSLVLWGLVSNGGAAVGLAQVALVALICGIAGQVIFSIWSIFQSRHRVKVQRAEPSAMVFSASLPAQSRNSLQALRSLSTRIDSTVVVAADEEGLTFHLGGDVLAIGWERISELTASSLRIGLNGGLPALSIQVSEQERTITVALVPMRSRALDMSSESPGGRDALLQALIDLKKSATRKPPH